MDWRPSGYMLSTKDLVHAIFDGNSDAGKLLVKATMGEIELFSAPKSCCLLYTSPSPRDATLSRMPSSA